ncbi:hypothetical protein Tco_0509042, partial [Tanacetum coccineum]
SEDEVESVDNDIARSMASERIDFGTQSLLEQWRDSYENGYYNEDPYDDDMYEGQNLSDKLQKICDNFDIRMWDSPSSFLLIEIKRLLDDLRVTADQDVIENGNTAPKTTLVEGVEKIMPPITAEEKA